MTTPTNAPSALGAVVGAVQALEIEKQLRGETEDSLAGREVYCNLRSHSYNLTALHRNRACRFDHETWEIQPVRIATLQEAFNLAGPSGASAAARLRLFGDVFATTLDCPGCGASVPTLRPSQRLSSAERRCTACGAVRAVRGFDVLETLSIASLANDVLHRPLATIGLFANDVFTLRDASGQATHFRILDEHDPVNENLETVAIVGCGNIGSHLVGHVARIPLVKRVILVDPDIYQAKNLHGQDIDREDLGSSKVERQAARIRAIRPGLAISAFRDRFEQVPLATFRRSLIASCVDSRGARRDINRAACRLGVTWIDGAVGGSDLLARVAAYPPGTARPCIECEWDDDDYAAIARTEMACRMAQDATGESDAVAREDFGVSLPDSSSMQPDSGTSN
jgi:molybdopterin/thiamine biosynthesis adenylyltransferase